MLTTSPKRLLSTAAATLLLAAGAGAAASAPALASSPSHCAVAGTTYSSAPFSSTLRGVMCWTGTSAYCASSPELGFTTAWWASPFITVIYLHKGCFFDPHAYGGSETMWGNVRILVTSPLGVLPAGAVETVYLRVYLTPSGHYHSSAWAQ